MLLGRTKHPTIHRVLVVAAIVGWLAAWREPKGLLGQVIQ